MSLFDLFSGSEPQQLKSYKDVPNWSPDYLDNFITALYETAVSQAQQFIAKVKHKVKEDELMVLVENIKSIALAIIICCLTDNGFGEAIDIGDPNLVEGLVDKEREFIRENSGLEKVNERANIESFFLNENNNRLINQYIGNMEAKINNFIELLPAGQNEKEFVSRITNYIYENHKSIGQKDEIEEYCKTLVANIRANMIQFGVILE